MSFFSSLSDLGGSVLNYFSSKDQNKTALKVAEAQKDIAVINNTPVVTVPTSTAISNEVQTQVDEFTENEFAGFMTVMSEEAIRLDNVRNDILTNVPSPVDRGSPISKSPSISPVVLAIVGLGLYLAKRGKF